MLETTLQSLFDYQRFEREPSLQDVIDSVLEKYAENRLVSLSDDDVALASDAKSAGMVCLAQSVSFIASRIGSRSFKRTYVFSSDDEVSNLGNGITLARQLVEQHVVGDPTPYVFMFSSSPVAGAVVDAVSSEVNASLGENADASDIKVRLKRVDWIRNTVDMLLDTYPLFATGLDEGCMDGLEFEPKLTFDYEPSKRHILIVGESMFAVEYLKGFRKPRILRDGWAAIPRSIQPAVLFLRPARRRLPELFTRERKRIRRDRPGARGNR